MVVVWSFLNSAVVYQNRLANGFVNVHVSWQETCPETAGAACHCASDADKGAVFDTKSLWPVVTTAGKMLWQIK